ncbi:MAG TPA: alpha/beta hydrolase [Steroidobacteraceae bacterium]|nr:alpha/beta hydrolase [Steroidobacteraceae bacterium]
MMRWLVVATLATAGAAMGAALGTPAALRVGTLELHACEPAGAYCGALERPLDPLGLVPGTVSVYFEYYAHRLTGPAIGTLVGSVGGPGYSTTDSREAYLTLFAPLRGDRDVLLVDNRGTGRSGAIDCPGLQRDPVLTVEAIGTCGADLGPTAPLYSTAYAGDDLVAILDALGIATIDLYGDSEGTFFAQVFAVRHGARLRSLVLDGAYPLAGTDIPWYPSYAPAMRDKFNRACERSAWCRAVPGTSIDHIAPALRELRARPFRASATDYDGNLQRFTANAGVLAIVMFGAAPPEATLRETDAAARAFASGDRLPLLRLMAETIANVDSRDPTRDPQKFSEGLAAALWCQDGPQIFDMRLAPDARRADRDRALAARRATAPDTYAPFSIDEFRAMPLDYAFLDECVDWPVADQAHPASHVVADDAVFPPVPVLVLSGEIDNMTTVADGAAAAAQFPRARQIVIANGFHVGALWGARSDCGAQLVQAFIANPDAANGPDARCAAEVPAVRLAPPFVRGFARATAARARPGNRAARDGLVAAAAAVHTVGDLLPRLAANSSGRGVGLRGGKFTVTTGAGGRRTARLAKLRWAEDLWVSGTVAWTPDHGEALARIRFRTARGMAGRLTARWPDGVADARARLDGTVAGQALAAEMPAP